MARSLYGGRLEQVGVNVGAAPGYAISLKPNDVLPTLYDGPLDDVGRVAVNDFLLDNDNDGIYETAVTTIPTDATGIPRFFMGPDNVRPLYDLAGHAMLPTEVSAVGAVPAASESTPGISEISSDAEADGGTDHLTQMTPKQVKRRIDAHNVDGSAHPDIRTAINDIVAGGVSNGSVTNAKLADMTQATIKGRAVAAGTGVPVDLTPTQARTILNVADGATANVQATEILAGLLEIATQAETNTGADDQRAVTPLKLQTRMAAYAQPLNAANLSAIAALTTTSYGRALLTLANQAGLMALLSAATTSTAGVVPLATDAEAIAGTVTTKATTPANLAAALAGFTATEQIQDTLNTTLVEGAKIDLTYDDTAGTLTVAHLEPTPRTITGAATLALGDANAAIYFTGGSAAVLTVPTNASVAFATDTQVEVWALGAGALTITASAGVTLNGVSAGSYTPAQFSRTVLRKTGTNAWAASGGGSTVGTLATVVAGTILRCPWNGSAWTYAGTALTDRPSTRTDIFFQLTGAPYATADPSWMLTGDDRIDL